LQKETIPFIRKTETSKLQFRITETGSAGKSSLVDELVRRFLNFLTIGLISVDPSKRKNWRCIIKEIEFV
jgi:methylmalonyl-CoA mutase